MGKLTKKSKILIPLVIFGIILFIAAGSRSYKYVESNEFCGYLCHQMTTRSAIWQKSSHGNVKCLTCHSETGIVGSLKAHIEGIHFLKSYMRNKTDNITIVATEKNPAKHTACLRCHPVETLISETKDIRMNHYDHIVIGKYLCGECHENAIHSTHSFEEKRIKPQEDNCLSCHMALGINTNCGSCHIKKVVRSRKQAYVLDKLEDIGVRNKGDH